MEKLRAPPFYSVFEDNKSSKVATRIIFQFDAASNSYIYLPIRRVQRLIFEKRMKDGKYSLVAERIELELARRLIRELEAICTSGRELPNAWQRQITTSTLREVSMIHTR